MIESICSRARRGVETAPPGRPSRTGRGSVKRGSLFDKPGAVLPKGSPTTVGPNKSDLKNRTSVGMAAGALLPPLTTPNRRSGGECQLPAPAARRAQPEEATGADDDRDTD